MENTLYIHRTDSVAAVDEDRITHTVLSHNKCGRTWIKLVMYHVILDTYGTLAARGSVCSADDGRQHPFVLFTHDPNRLRNGRTVVLIRDPRSVMSSWFYHVTRRRIATRGAETLPRDYPIADFIRSPKWGMLNYINFAHFIEQQQPSGCLYVWLERLKDDPVAGFRRILDYMDIQTSDRILNNALEKSEFRFVKACIREENYKAFYPLPGVDENGEVTDDLRQWMPADSEDQQSYPLRGYAAEFTDSDTQYINDQMKLLPGRWRY